MTSINIKNNGNSNQPFTPLFSSQTSTTIINSNYLTDSSTDITCMSTNPLINAPINVTNMTITSPESEDQENSRFIHPLQHVEHQLTWRITPKTPYWMTDATPVGALLRHSTPNNSTPWKPSYNLPFNSTNNYKLTRAIGTNKVDMIRSYLKGRLPTQFWDHKYILIFI